MMIYGVCMFDIENIKEEGILELIKMADSGVLEDYLQDKEDNEKAGFSCSASEWISDYENDEGECGLGALLKDVIGQKEEVNIYYWEQCGYLGLMGDVPWFFNEKTKNISREDYSEILKKYVGIITDDELHYRLIEKQDE